MNALDTNVLVRYLVADDPKQARRVKAVIERLDDDDERAYVSHIVVCELVWVLRSAYGFDRAAIAGALGQLVLARQLEFDAPDQLARALAAYETGSGDFSDYLIREHARAADCDAVLTFDKALIGDDMFAAP
jgi:predicted nucleic-acid-binding protein